jgi:hypothetical protein
VEIDALEIESALVHCIIDFHLVALVERCSGDVFLLFLVITTHLAGLELV